VRAERAESRSWRSQLWCIGVCPRGDQVGAPAAGAWKPVSSITMMLQPYLSGFFDPWAVFPPPALDGRLIPLPSPALRLLGGEAQLPHDTPDVAGMVLHPKGAFDYRSFHCAKVNNIWC